MTSRRCVSRNQIEDLFFALVPLQARLRGVLLRRNLAFVLLSAVEIQRIWRGQKCRQLVDTKRFEELSAAILLQSVVRFKARRIHKRRERAINLILRNWHIHHAYLSIKLIQHGAKMIQTAFRRYRDQKVFHRFKQSVSILQRTARQRIQPQIILRRSRRLDIATVSTQTFAHPSTCRTVYMLETSSVLRHRTLNYLTSTPSVERRNLAALLIQDSFRRYIAYLALSTKESHGLTQPSSVVIASILIQSVFRRYFARNLYRSISRTMHSAARKIQVAYLTWQMELTLLNVQSSVVLLQRSVRGQLVRSATRFALDNMNACFRANAFTSFGRIVAESKGNEALCLSWTCAVDMARESACVVIQSAGRKMLAGKQYSIAFKRKNGSMLSPIPVSFGWPFSQNNRRSPKVTVSTTSQGIINRTPVSSPQITRQATNGSSEPMTKLNAIEISMDSTEILQECLIQGSVGGCTTCKSCILSHDAAIKIQSTVRGFVRRCQISSYQSAIVKVQSSIRTYIITKQFRTALFSAIQIQKTWRGLHRRSQARKMSNSAITVQKVARAFACRRDTEFRTGLALMLQALFRALENGKRQRNAYLRQLHAARVVQKLARQGMAVKHCIKLKSSIIKIQSIFRGWKARAVYDELIRESDRLYSQRLRPLVELMIISDVVHHAHDSLNSIMAAGADSMGPSPPCVRRLTVRVNALPPPNLMLSPFPEVLTIESASLSVLDITYNSQKDTEGTPKSSNASTSELATRWEIKGAPPVSNENAFKAHLKRGCLKVPKLPTYPPLVKGNATKGGQTSEVMKRPPQKKDTAQLARAAQLLLEEARKARHNIPKQVNIEITKSLTEISRQGVTKIVQSDEIFDSNLFGNAENDMPSPIKTPSSVEAWDWADQWT